MFIFPHETNNIYEMKPQDHEKLIMENITKTYQKVTEKLEKAVNMEVKNITKLYKPAERIDHLPPSWHTVLVLVVFWSRRRITLSQRCVLDVGATTKNKRCYNVVLTTSVFRDDINVAATSWFWCGFLDKHLKVFRYRYNFLFPKICNIALQFYFLMNKIYSACVSAKRSLKCWISEHLQLVAWTEKRNFWTCVVHWSETAPCFLTVNSVGSWFKYFLRSGNLNTGV